MKSVLTSAFVIMTVMTVNLSPARAATEAQVRARCIKFAESSGVNPQNRQRFIDGCVVKNMVSQKK